MPPLDLDDKDQLLDSSNDSALDDTLDPTLQGEGEGTEDAGSSDAQGDNTDDSTQGIVRDVVKERQDGTASPADGQKTGSEAADGVAKEEDNENYTDVPFHKHPRFQHLVRKSKALEGDARQFRQASDYMEANGVTHEEFASHLQLVALSKTDPQKAWEIAKPIVQQLLLAAGEVLPDDLKQMVAAGEMSAEAAAEVSRSRARVKSVETGQTFAQQRQERQQQRQASIALTDTATNWQKDRAAKDPNFQAKLQPLMEKVAFLIHTEGKPDTPEGVKAQLEKAYKLVVVPAARPGSKAPTVGQGVNRARPSANGSASGNDLQPEPKNTREIIRGIIAKRGS